MVARKDLCHGRPRVVEQDEVLEEIHERPLAAHTPKHSFEVDRAGHPLGEAFPFVEELVLAAKRANLSLEPVGEHHKRIEVEELRYGVLIVGIVVLIGTPDVLVVALELHEQQRYAVDKAHEVRPALVERPFHPHLLDGDEPVVLGVLEVENLRVLGVLGAVSAPLLHGDAVSKHCVLLLVGLEQRICGERGHERVSSLLALLDLQPLVQLNECVDQVATQHDLVVALAPEGAVLAQLLLVVRIDEIPAHLA